MYISPAAWWPVGFISLIYPFLLVLVLGLTFLSIFIRFRYVLLGLVSIALSFTTIMNIVPLRADAHFQMKKDERDIRILTWNIRRFTPYYRNYFDPKHNNFDTILIEVKKYDPDILCFQEFFTSKKNNEKTINEIKKLGYRYYAFNRHSFSNTEALDEGNIIFSKFPIIREINVEIDRASSFGWEKPIFADILIHGDTIRFGSFHLESFGFAQREYEDLAKIRDQNDSDLQSSKNIYGKMRSAFQQRSKQAELLSREITRSPYPLVVSGDLNDVPSSYAYLSVRGKLNDTFLEQGAGLGKTFMSGRSRFLTWLPTLRIDYIFTDQSIDVNQFSMTNGSLSDHRGVISDFQLPKKQ
jgi:endonuclease/exonuclease/phosphatase family metal-dependent hydrolase